MCILDGLSEINDFDLCGFLKQSFGNAASDSSLFIITKGSLHMVVLLYVDGMIVIGNGKEDVTKLQDKLAIRFEIKKMRELHHFLGLEVINMKNGFLSIKKKISMPRKF